MRKNSCNFCILRVSSHESARAESSSISEGLTPLLRKKSEMQGACFVFSGLKTIHSQLFEGKRGGERGKGKRLCKEIWRALQHKQGAFKC